MGLAWGVSLPVDLVSGIFSVVLSFLIINLSSIIGAQANTLYDYDLDLKDERKKELVQALDSFGHKKVRNVMILEILLTLVLVSALALYMQEPILLVLWAVGISLGVAFSAPPLRLKARFWIGPICQMLVLAVFPVLFAYYAFTSEVNAYFLMSLLGLSLTVYGVIVPTEIRDYFGDKAMGIQTLTVRIGLSRAALMGIILLGAGSALTAIALFLELVRNQLLVLGVFVLSIPVVVLFVLSKFWQLYRLTREFDDVNAQDHLAVEEKIADLSSENPKWIMLVTQTYMILSIMLLITKFLI